MERMIFKKTCLFFVLFVIVAFCCGFLGIRKGGQTRASIEPGQKPTYNGRKANVAVIDFEWGPVGQRGDTNTRITDSDGQTTVVEQRSYATGIQDEVSKALARNGHFKVLNRKNIGDLKGEMDLTKKGYTSKKTGVTKGRVIGADLYIKASITEWEPNAAGIGTTIRVPVPLLGRTGIRVGSSDARISMLVEVIDTSTWQTIVSQSVDGNARDFGVGVGFRTYPLSTNLHAWEGKPMGKALRACIAKLVDVIVAETPPEYFKH